MIEDRDPFFDTLLNLDGQVFYMGDKGHRVQFAVVAVPPSLQRPHGLAYTLTVHNPRGERIAGFDNAHGYHHRHYKGDVQAVEFVSYEATLERFQQEWLAIGKVTGGKRS
jgi:hypothetical protein